MRTKLIFSSISIVVILLFAVTKKIETASAKITTTREQQIHINPARYIVPAKKTDVAVTVEAYERLMAGYINSSERNFELLYSNMEEISKKLDRIEAKIDALNTADKKQMQKDSDPNLALSAKQD